MTDQPGLRRPDLQQDQHQRPAGPAWGTQYTAQCYELLKTCGTGEMDDFAVLAQGVTRCLGGMLQALVSAILSERGKQDKDEDKKDVSYYEASRFPPCNAHMANHAPDHSPFKPIRPLIVPCAFIPIDHHLHFRNQRHHPGHSAAGCRGV